MNNNQSQKFTSSIDAENLDWAKEAYLKLKKEQEKQKTTEEIHENTDLLDNQIKNTDSSISNDVPKDDLSNTNEIKESEKLY